MIKQRLLRLEKAAKKRLEEIHADKQRKLEEHGNAFKRAIFDSLSDEHLRLLRDFLAESAPEVDQSLTYTVRDGIPIDVKPGGKLLAWINDRYKDFAAGLPVSVAPAIAEAIINFKPEEGQYDLPDNGSNCEDCQLTVPISITECPLCGGRCGYRAYQFKHSK